MESGFSHPDPTENWGAEDQEPVTLATTAAYPVRLLAVEEPGTPAGAVTMVSCVGPCIVARSLVEADVPRILTERGLFAAPVRIAATVSVRPRGHLLAQFFALAPFDAGAEPAAPRYPGRPEPLEVDESEAYMWIPLGRTSRRSRERLFPWDLEAEATDLLLVAVGEGRAVEDEVRRLTEPPLT